MAVGLAWKSAAKSNEKLVNQKYATLFLSWMPFRKTKPKVPCHCFLGKERHQNSVCVEIRDCFCQLALWLKKVGTCSFSFSIVKLSDCKSLDMLKIVSFQKNVGVTFLDIFPVQKYCMIVYRIGKFTLLG